MKRLHHAKPARAAQILGGLLALQFAAGCAFGSSGAAADVDLSPRPSAPATIDQLGAKMGCAARVQSKNSDFQQGRCDVKGAGFTMATFAEDPNVGKWLKASQAYGGWYLVGTRWVVVGNDPKALEGFREQLGGTIKQGAQHGGGGGHHG